MIDFQQIAHEINTQDNRITHEPLFCVYEKERVYGIDPRFSDGDGYELDDDGEKIYYVERDKFVNAHFTEKAAEHHIRINGHNLNQPFIFVTSLRRCPEMIAIRHALANYSAIQTVPAIICQFCGDEFSVDGQGIRNCCAGR